MYDFYPYFTNDGSVGLFSPSDDDIYHSTYGAATEAYEKFIFPADLEKHFFDNEQIKVLDICFGIGYNSKSFLNYFLEIQKNFSIKNNKCKKILSEYNVQIYTNNNIGTKCNDKIYVDNISDKNLNNTLYESKKNSLDNFKIYIKAIDTDKILAYLSPFILSNGKIPAKNYKLPFKNDKISHFLDQEDNKKTKKNLNSGMRSLIKYPDSLNVVLLNKIIENYPDILQNFELAQILSDKKYKQYFTPYILGLFDFYKYKAGYNSSVQGLSYFLHNIYYKYLSKRHKMASNSLLSKNFCFDLKIRDARAELLDDKNVYDFVFLDAFTPAKCPCLWTVDFFKLLFEHLNENGMILTYSNSAAIRNAFLSAGFYVGKIFNPSANKYTGTIAVKNQALIKHELSEYDLGLVKTRAGIFYRDENFNASNEAIIAVHKQDVENSKLISSSKYIKTYKRSSNEI